MTKKPFIKETVSSLPMGVVIAGAPLNKQRGGLRYKKTRDEKIAVTPAYLHSLNLQERDQAIVRYLGEIGFATTGQLKDLFFAEMSYEWASKQLTWLWEQHLLNRRVGSGLPKYGIKLQLVYSLGRAGVSLLREMSSPDEKKKRPASGSVLLLHNTLLSEYLASLARNAQAEGWRFTFCGERGANIQFQSNERWVRLRPDGLVYLSHLTELGERPLFIEMDTSTRALDTYMAKILQYQLYLSSPVWKSRHGRFPYIAVITWAAHPAGQSAVAQACRIEMAERRLGFVLGRVKDKWEDSSLWVFARLDQALTDEWRLLEANGKVRQVQLLSATKRAKPGGIVRR